MHYVLQTIDRDSVTIKSKSMKLWANLLLLCFKELRTLLGGGPVYFSLENEYLLKAMGVEEGPDDMLRVSVEQLSAWVEEEVCKPILEMIQELRVESCNYVFYEGTPSKCSHFQNMLKKICTDLVSFFWIEKL